MKKSIITVFVLIWVAMLLVLIVALTNVWPGNPFSNYKIVVVIGFLSISGFMRKVYKKFVK